MQKEEMWSIATEDSKWSEIELQHNKYAFLFSLIQKQRSKILQLKVTQ